MKIKSVRTVLLTFVSIVASATLFSQTKEEIMAKVQNTNNEMAKAMVAGDSEKGLSFYDEDAISLPNYAPMVKGIEAIKKSNEEMMKSGMKFKSFEFKTLKVKICDNQITEIGTYKMSMTMPEMPESIEDTGKYVNIWEKQSDGSLKIKVEMWNTDKMPMQQ